MKAEEWIEWAWEEVGELEGERDYTYLSLSLSRIESYEAVRVYVCVHAHRCTCMWRPEVDVRYHLQSLSTPVLEADSVL